MTRRVVLIKHGDEPADDRVSTFLQRHGVDVEYRLPFKGESLGPVDESVAGTVVFGGPFIVTETDKHPFLLDEARWLEQSIKRELPVLGICQGAHAVAHVLGAKVGPLPGEPHEFGYYPIYPTPSGRVLMPESLYVTQAHFHGFDVPSGAELLASSELFAHQAIRYGKCTFAFQFHAEVTTTGFKRFQATDWARYGKPGAQTKTQQDQLMAEHDTRQHEWFMGFLETLFEDVLAEKRATATT